MRPALLLLILLFLIPRAAAAQEPPTFRPVDCAAFEVAEGWLPDAACGFVDAAVDPGNPALGTIEIAVLRVRAGDEPLEEPPVLYIHGGPGGSIIGDFAATASLPWTVGREVIFVDQRGGGFSSGIACEDVRRPLLELMAGDLPFDATVEGARRLTLDCHQRLRDGDGEPGHLGPAAFGTRATAADMEAVRQALGIERWRLVGVSYGTTVAMTMAALYPESVDGIVLDSAYPPDPLPMEVDGAYRSGLARLFAACAEQADCAASFPDMAGTYRAALDRLAAEPLVVPVPERFGLAGDRLVMSAEEFEGWVQGQLYSHDDASLLPHVFAAVARGDGDALRAVMALTLDYLADTAEDGVYEAVECRDRARYRTPLPADAPALDRGDLFSVCADLGPAGPPPLLSAEVPALVLAGGLDPITPPDYGSETAARIGAAATLAIFPNMTHGVMYQSPCAMDLVDDFLAAPGRELDTGCAAYGFDIPFVTEVVALPGLAAWWYEVASGSAGMAGAMPSMAGLLALLCGAVFIVRDHGRSGQGWRCPGTRAAVAGIFLAAGLTLILLVLPVIPKPVLLWGLPSGWAWLRWVPWAAAALLALALARSKADRGAKMLLAGAHLFFAAQLARLDMIAGI